MKLFLILFLISLNTWAGFVAGSKINDCNRASYTSPSDCSVAEGEQCFKVPDDSGECGIFKLKNTHGGPRKSVDECSGKIACEALLAEKNCLASQDAFIDADYSFVYCMDITGKEMVIDQSLKAQKDLQKAQTAQIETLISNGKKAREACERVLDLIGGFNLLPGRTTEQAGQMTSTFTEALTALQAGRPGAAKTAIQAIPVDGVLVTQAMKDLALEQLKDW